MHYPSVIVETPSCFLGLIYASYIDNGVCIIDFQISGLLAIGDGGITYSRDRRRDWHLSEFPHKDELDVKRD